MSAAASQEIVDIIRFQFEQTQEGAMRLGSVLVKDLNKQVHTLIRGFADQERFYVAEHRDTFCNLISKCGVHRAEDGELVFGGWVAEPRTSAEPEPKIETDTVDIISYVFNEYEPTLKGVIVAGRKGKEFIGSGFSAEQRNEVWQAREHYAKTVHKCVIRTDLLYFVRWATEKEEYETIRSREGEVGTPCPHCKVRLPKKLVLLIKKNEAKCPRCGNLKRCSTCGGPLVRRYVPGNKNAGLRCIDCEGEEELS